LLKRYVEPLLEAKADTIVLGCTHYPFVRAMIESLVGPNIVLIDTGDAVAKHLRNRLQEKELLNQSINLGEASFWSNSNSDDAQKVIRALWGSDVALKKLLA
jgi:glutamate racemase